MEGKKTLNPYGNRQKAKGLIPNYRRRSSIEKSDRRIQFSGKPCFKWMKSEEQEWHQKSRASMDKGGDNNTKFIHQYANFRKNLNTIWDIKNENGTTLSSFKEKVEVGVSYFKNLFTEPPWLPYSGNLRSSWEISLCLHGRNEPIFEGRSIKEGTFLGPLFYAE
jgi:hypothetical protein